MVSRARAAAAEPIGRGAAAISRRSLMARPAEKPSAALRSGAGGGTPSGVTPTTTSAATTATTSAASREFLSATVSG